MQNKPDVGANIARQWFDVDHVDMIVDVPNSGVALAVNEVAREKNKVFIVSGAASSDLTGPKCSPDTIHWTYDTWMLANGTGKALVKTGGDTWFFLTADYAFGHALERDTTAVVLANGGKVLGSVSSSAQHQRFLFVSCCRRRRRKQRSSASPMPAATPSTRSSRAPSSASRRAASNLPDLLVFISDVNSLGLKTAQGLGSDRDLVLGHDRRQPRLDQALAGRAAGQISDHGAGRRLLGGHALPEGGRRAQKRRRRQGGRRQDEGNADRRSAVRQGHASAPTAARSTPPICSR